MTKIRVWLSHDGYRDPDDNLALLVGAAHASAVEKSNPDVTVAGVIFGDTTDGGQYHMYHPKGSTPARMDGDPRFDDVGKNKVAAANYAFFQKYGRPAVEQLAPDWQVIDSIEGEVERTWNYNPVSVNGLSEAARELFADIRAAIVKGGDAESKEVVVYSAGGGAHVAAEAIALLRHHGIREEVIKKHFAIIQHGRSNFELNLEPEARSITRPYTIAISKQDDDAYPNGMSGPGLGKLVRNGVDLDGSHLGAEMGLALDVAQGLRPFENLGSNKSFRKTVDGSDAGSHAFAVDQDALLANWWKRLEEGETLSSDRGREHQIEKADGGYRLRVIYGGFTWQDVRALLNRPGAAAEEAKIEAAARTATAVTVVEADDAAAVAALGLGEADVFAFRADGTATEAVAGGGRVGAPGLGGENDIARGAAGSEKLLVDLGQDADAIAIVLAGLERQGRAQEAAEVTGYDADGDLVEAMLVTANGRTRLAFDEDVRYVTIEAAEWQGDGPLPEANPDLGLAWIEAL